MIFKLGFFFAYGILIGYLQNFIDVTKLKFCCHSPQRMISVCTLLEFRS